MQGSVPSSLSVASLPIGEVVPVFFFLIFVVWAIYSIVAAYHWLRYGNNTTTALCALSVHLIVSAWLAIYAVSGLTGIQ